MEQNALTLLHAYRFAMVQHPAVDGERAVADLVTVRHALGQGSFHGAFSLRLQFFDLGGGREKVLRHIAALTERGFKLFQDQKDFPVVPARFVFRLDINRTDLAAVLSGS